MIFEENIMKTNRNYRVSSHKLSYLKVKPQNNYYLFVEEEGEGLHSATAIIVINARKLITTIRRSLSRTTNRSLL